MQHRVSVRSDSPSMKVPPKRKGNPNPAQATSHRRALNESPSEKEGKSPLRNTTVRRLITLNESPSEKEGKCIGPPIFCLAVVALNESPSEKEGKFPGVPGTGKTTAPSMKVPPKRKGNLHPRRCAPNPWSALNESPSEKEGKSATVRSILSLDDPSMKVPPKRKGNPRH